MLERVMRSDPLQEGLLAKVRPGRAPECIDTAFASPMGQVATTHHPYCVAGHLQNVATIHVLSRTNDNGPIWAEEAVIIQRLAE
jgi:hypothetical protein